MNGLGIRHMNVSWVIIRANATYIRRKIRLLGARVLPLSSAAASSAVFFLFLNHDPDWQLSRQVRGGPSTAACQGGTVVVMRRITVFTPFIGCCRLRSRHTRRALCWLAVKTRSSDCPVLFFSGRACWKVAGVPGSVC